MKTNCDAVPKKQKKKNNLEGKRRKSLVSATTYSNVQKIL
jgi:hypothetical protein